MAKFDELGRQKNVFLSFEGTELLTLQCQGQQFLAEVCLYWADAKKEKLTNAGALSKSQRASKHKH